MRQIFSIFLLLLMLTASAVFAWQPITIADGTSTVTELFYGVTPIRDGADGASAVQVKNSGSGVLSVSLWRFTTTVLPATPVFPFNAAVLGQAYYGVADSVYTLASGETLFIDEIPASKRPHWAHIKRSGTGLSSTSVKVLWQ